MSPLLWLFPPVDLAVWVEKEGDRGCKICDTFFEKAVTAPTVFHDRADFGWRSKIKMLLEEMRRRYRNMDQDHSQPDMLRVVRDFATKMASSGCKKAARMEILMSATVKFYREVAEWKTGGKPL